MKKVLTFILITALSAIVSFTGNAQITASHAFISAPKTVLPLLDHNTRLDMLDYFNSGMTTTSTNALNGKSSITALSPQSIRINISSASSCQIAVLPATSDTLVAVISTVATPAPDSKMTVYKSDWSRNETEKVFKRPSLKDWLTETGLKNYEEVETLVPFLLINYNYDPESSTLTLTNNTKDFLSDEVYSIVEQYLLTSITYRWNGKKFNQIKQ